MRRLIADLDHVGARVLLLKGGNGGFGNAHFKSSTNQAPRRANPGQPGQEKIVWLRLKLIADVGLIGLPECGEIDVSRAGFGGQTQNRGLSVHNA